MENQNIDFPFEIVHVDPVYASDQAASDHMEEVRKLLLNILFADE